MSGFVASRAPFVLVFPADDDSTPASSMQWSQRRAGYRRRMRQPFHPGRLHGGL